MQDSRINYVVVGAFVAAMLVAFIVVISMLAGRTGSTDTYYTVYDNVGGIKFGTLVFYEGYQVGQVESVEPSENTRQMSFKITLTVQEGWKIPEDSIARAMASGLLSAVAIDIDGGKSQNFLKPGAEIKGMAATNMFATLADIGAQFGDLSTNSIKPLLDNLNKYVSEIGDTTVERLPAIMADLEKLAGNLQRTTAVVEKDLLKPENRERLNSILVNFDKTSANLAEVSEGLQETKEVLNKSMTNVNKMIEDNAGNVNESMRNMRYALDTVARYVDEISHNAAATARNMSEFSRSIRENPGLLLGGAERPDQAEGAAK